jgi:ribonuclease HI
MREEVQRLGTNLERQLKASRPPRSATVNPQTLLREFKTKVREAYRSYDKRLQPMLKTQIEKLSEKLRVVANDPDLSQEEIKISTVQIKKEIQRLIKETHKHNRDAQSAIDAAEGEKIGKTWSNRFKESKPRDTIKCLQDPVTGTPTGDSNRMAQIAASYHERIQFDDHDPHTITNGPKLEAALSNIRVRLSEESKQKLREGISEGEVRAAIRKTNNDKAPGLDGIPVELWKSLDDQFKNNKSSPKKKCDIVWCLTRVFQDVEKYGNDRTAKLNEGCMSPIYKKKDPDNIANYRPITLLNTDYKVYTKAISLRLADAAPEIINPDQAGFIRNRSIFDQVKTTKLVTDYMSRANKRGAIIALDQEKAYDKILHPYLWEVLRKFGFPEEFIRIIQTLYDNAETTVMINGEMSLPFVIYRGVRQGDALSCLLFDIAIEPLAAAIRNSADITGILIPGTKKHLKVKLFADDTTVFLSETDSVSTVQTLLGEWCEVSGAKFNIEKTEVIPLGNLTQRNAFRESRKLNDENEALPANIRIAKDGEPVRILGAWIGNEIDQAVTWAPILENVCKRLKKWGAARHSLEGRRLIIQMQVAGVTQYLTKVQGMPKDIEAELNKQARKFMWNYEKTDTVNQAQMYAPHKRGGKKLLDIEARNKAIHLTWLQAYLNIGPDRATWTFFADAIIGADIPTSHQIDADPESRVMPILQTWETRARGSNLPEDLRQMLKLAREYNTRVTATNPTGETKENLPMWYHIRSDPSARKLYKTKTAKCLRKKHGIRLAGDALRMLENTDESHELRNGCRCHTCSTLRTDKKCTHPHDCMTLATALMNKILPKWDPRDGQNATQEPARVVDFDLEEGEKIVEKTSEATDTRDAITIFNDPPTTQIPLENPSGEGEAPPTTTTVYTDGACINNGHENARAGSGVWYGDDDPRNVSSRTHHRSQTNQTGELFAILIAVRDNPPNDDLRIISDSRYAIDGLTKNARKWEDRNWAGVQNGDIFRDITAWIRWRKGVTTLRWTKGHDGTRGNEGADKLAAEGAGKQIAVDQTPPPTPQNLTARGAKLTKLEQKDFYKIIRDKRRIPTRTRTDRLVGRVQACTENTFDIQPTEEAIWTATKHKDFTRKTRDYLWKSTQHAYKIGEYWENIPEYEGRGICPLCNEREDMDHILTSCNARARSKAWELANDLWRRRSNTPLPTNLGDILGCGLATFKTTNGQDSGKNRIYRIIMSETAYLIWKLRNERRIRDDDGQERQGIEAETESRWINALNKRLTIDRLLTNGRRFGKRAMKEKLVKKTWGGCLDNEEGLPRDWYKRKEVLVGISLARRPPGRAG